MIILADTLVVLRRICGGTSITDPVPSHPHGETRYFRTTEGEEGYRLCTFEDLVVETLEDTEKDRPEEIRTTRQTSGPVRSVGRGCKRQDLRP